jgi:hypothetical protein
MYLESAGLDAAINSLAVAQVSKWPAVSREQLDEWKLLWPMNFHEMRK